MSNGVQIWSGDEVVREGDLTATEIAQASEEIGSEVRVRAVTYRSEAFAPGAGAPFVELRSRSEERAAWRRRRGEPVQNERIHVHSNDVRCDGTFGCITVT